MANFFQPGDPKTTVEKTASPAEAATLKFKAELLGRFLEAMGGNRPNFSEFVKGGSATKPFPTGFGGDVSSLLEAMNQPGAFTSTTSTNYNLGSPSGMSDLSSMLGLGLSLNDILGNPVGKGVNNIWDFLNSLRGSSGQTPDQQSPYSLAPQSQGQVPDVSNWNFSLAQPFSLAPQQPTVAPDDLANWSWSLA